MIIEPILIFVYTFTIFVSLVYILIYIKNKNKFILPLNEKFPKVTFLIPVYNGEGFIDLTIKSILEINYPLKQIEIIVVDDGSKDKTSEVVKSFKEVKLIKKSNGGKASAINAGIKYITGEYTVILDADTILEKDILKKCLSYFNNKDVGAVIPTLRPYNPKKIIEKMQVLEYAMSTFVRSLMSTYEALPAAPACTLFKTEVLKKTGGYDEYNLTEDFEMALKLKKMGYNIYNAINASAYTFVPDKLNKLYKQRLRWCFGTAYNLKKHKDIFGFKNGDFGWFFMPIFIISIFIGVLLLLLLVYDLTLNSYNLLRHMALINYNIIFDFSNLSFLNIITNLRNILAIVSTILALYLFIQVRKYYNFEKKDKNLNFFKYLVFVLIYTPFLLYVWVISLIYFVIGYKPKW